MEESLVDWEAELEEVHHFGRSYVDVMDIDISLVVSLRGESVKDALGSLVDTEDHNFIDDLGSGLGVEVLVADGLGNSHELSIVVVANLCSLMMSVVVVLSIIQVEVTGGVRNLTHGVDVDLETDGVIDRLEKGSSAINKVEDGEDGATSDEGALLGIGNTSDVNFIG